MRFFTAFRGFRALLALAVLASAWCTQRLAAQAFGTAVVVPTGNQPVAVYTADVNGDGIPDLIYVDAGATPTASTTHVLLGDGKGNFTQSATIVTAGDSVAIGNLSQSGHIDIAWLTCTFKMGTPGGSVITWYIAPGKGDGTFGAPISSHIAGYFVGTSLLQFHRVVAADVHGNSSISPQIAAVDTTYANLFRFPTRLSIDFADSIPMRDGAGTLSIADLNGDGLDDFVVDGLQHFYADIALDQPTSQGSSFALPNPPNFGGTNGVHSLLIHDFNGDGKPDMAAEGASGRIDIFPGNGDGTFSTSSIGGTTSVDSTTGDGGQLLAAADLNNDGRPDLITYNPATANDPLGVSVELATASGNFSLLGVYPVPTGSHSSFATADFNQDGRLDLAMDTPGGIAILYGKATVGTTPATGTFSTGPATAFEAAIPMTVTLSGTSGNPVPTGTVTFTVTGTTTAVTPVALPLQNGVASYTFPAVTPNTGGNPVLPGTPTFTATYSGDSTYAAKTLTATHAVNLGITTVTLTPAPPTTAFPASYFYGQPVNGYVNISPQDSQFKATGTWTQLNNNAPVAGCIGLPNTVSSVCPYGYPTLLDTGSYSFVEQYNGGPANGDPVNGTAGSAPYDFTVQPSPTATNVKSSNNSALVGSPITFTVGVASTVAGDLGVPTGTISLTAGGQILATALPLNAAGQTSLTTSSLAAGSYAVTAVYTPSAVAGSSAAVYDFLPSSSATLTQVVNPAGPTDFTLTVTPLPVSLTPGGVAVLLVTVKSTGGFNAPVALSCTGLNTTNQIGCAFALATLPGGGGSATLALSTLAPYPCGQPANHYAGIQQAACGTGAPAAGQVRPSTRNLAFGGAIFAGVLLIGPLRRRRRLGLLAAVFSLSGLLTLSGCGNCTNLGTEPGSYTIDVVGTSSGATAITHAVVVNINVHL